MSDFQNRPEFDPNRPMTTREDMAWGWIGAAAVVIVLVLIFAFGGRSTNNTASNGPTTTMSQTTGQGSSSAPPARQPSPIGPSTTGSGAPNR
ncbi:MAG TPA: hypothetical protein VFB45_19335 [Pseudolabrys sp.]|nr:hypothetical protein [Pseudolabrys sp.]